MKAYFPKRIFWRSFWTHVSAYLFVVFFGLGVGYWFLVPELGPISKDEFHHLVGPWLLKVLPLLMIYMVVVSLWFSYHSVKPLAQIIKTVRGMVNRRGLSAVEMDDDEVFEEEEGEYYELDVALSRVRRKLKKKYDQLDQLREESETLMMSMADAVVSVDGQQRLVFFNSHFAKHFLTQSQAQKTTYFSDALRDPELLSLVNQAISKGEVGERSISLASVLEGRERDYGVSISPLRRPGEGNIYGALVVFHDISHLKRAERMRIEFLSNVSHELRTPLTTVKGYVDLVKDDLDSGKIEGAKEFVPILSRNINRLVDLVNDLLLISKLESAPELQIEVNDTYRLSEIVKEEFSRQLQAKGQHFIVTADAPVVKADTVKLQQIIRNLVSNAIRYGPERGNIELKWIPVAGGIEVRVRDQGLGISEVHQARLFERFYRVDKGRSRELGGTGLGLAIVKHLMLAHKGTISVRSKLGEGSEFICFFPQGS
jgi:two-component system phosphate regulon sensor histidine kinase PhoR